MRGSTERLLVLAAILLGSLSVGITAAGQDKGTVSATYPTTWSFLEDFRAYFGSESERGNPDRFRQFIKKNYVSDPEWEQAHEGLPNLSRGVIGKAQKFVGACFKSIDEGNQEEARAVCAESEAFLQRHHYRVSNPNTKSSRADKAGIASNDSGTIPAPKNGGRKFKGECLWAGAFAMNDNGPNYSPIKPDECLFMLQGMQVVQKLTGGYMISTPDGGLAYLRTKRILEQGLFQSNNWAYLTGKYSYVALDGFKKTVPALKIYEGPFPR